MGVPNKGDKNRKNRLCHVSLGDLFSADNGGLCLCAASDIRGVKGSTGKGCCCLRKQNNSSPSGLLLRRRMAGYEPCSPPHRSWLASDWST